MNVHKCLSILLRTTHEGGKYRKKNGSLGSLRIGGGYEVSPILLTIWVISYRIENSHPFLFVRIDEYCTSWPGRIKAVAE